MSDKLPELNAITFQCIREAASSIDAITQNAALLHGEALKIKADLAEAVRLLREARDSVEYEVQDNAANWGELLMHKQQPAIDCLSRIDAFLAKHGDKS